MDQTRYNSEPNSSTSSQYGLTDNVSISEIEAYEYQNPSCTEFKVNTEMVNPSPIANIESDISMLTSGSNLNILTNVQSTELI